MDTYALVRPEHLNHHGYLFGGQLLKWVDEYAWLCAARDFPGFSLVTRAMDQIEFRTPVQNGSIVRFCVLPEKKGDSSITYTVNVFADAPGDSYERLVFSNKITFVSVGKDGKKVSLPKDGMLWSERENCKDGN